MQKLLSQSNFAELLKAIKKVISNNCELFASYCLNYIDISYNNNDDNYYMTLDIDDIKNGDIYNASYKIIVLGDDDKNISDMTFKFKSLTKMLIWIHSNFNLIGVYRMYSFINNYELTIEY